MHHPLLGLVADRLTVLSGTPISQLLRSLDRLSYDRSDQRPQAVAPPRSSPSGLRRLSMRSVKNSTRSSFFS